MNLNFECTQCGRCCRGLKLLLSVEEAQVWMAQGHRVQLLCEAIPWPAEPPAEDLTAAYRRRQSFAAQSGALPVRVLVTLVASFEGDCPNLTPSGQCSIYLRRPAVCRIYPAEINPYRPLLPQAKACPPEAWHADRPRLMRAGQLVDATTRELIEQVRHQTEQDVAAKALLCAKLGVRVTGFANEGFAVHTPEPAALLQALSQTEASLQWPDMPAPAAPTQGSWCFMSDNAGLTATLQEIGAEAVAPAALRFTGVDYLRLRPDVSTEMA